jgi:8-amino-7-oxononanoate synthase
VRLSVKKELQRELALEIAQGVPDIGVRAGLDPLHPVHRSTPVVSFASWDLLGLVQRREIAAASVQALSEFGSSPSSNRFAGALTAAHLQAEQRVAQFFLAESATLFSTRNQAVLTTITALCSEGVVVIGSTLTTLPLADACTLVGAEYVEFDGEAQLRLLLEKYAFAKRVLVVVESLSLVTGAACELGLIAAAVEASSAWLLLDDTGLLGISGLRGAGSAETIANSPSLLGRLAGFSNVPSVNCAAVAGCAELKELLTRRSRYLRFEQPPSASAARSLQASLDAIELLLSTRERLAVRSKVVFGSLIAQGWKVVGAGDLPVLSLWCDSVAVAHSIQEALLQRGILVDSIPAKGIRKNGAVVRILLSIAHTDSEIEKLLEGLGEIRKRLFASDSVLG